MLKKSADLRAPPPLAAISARPLASSANPVFFKPSSSFLCGDRARFRTASGQSRPSSRRNRIWDYEFPFVALPVTLGWLM
jgi:hypothetical protein